jgi:hypothetical protein
MSKQLFLSTRRSRSLLALFDCRSNYKCQTAMNHFRLLTRYPHHLLRSASNVVDEQHDRPLQQTVTDSNRLQQTATDCNRLQQTLRKRKPVPAPSDTFTQTTATRNCAAFSVQLPVILLDPNEQDDDRDRKAEEGAEEAQLIIRRPVSLSRLLLQLQHPVCFECEHI